MSPYFGVTLTIFQKFASPTTPVLAYLLKNDFLESHWLYFNNQTLNIVIKPPYNIFEDVKEIDKVTPKVSNMPGDFVYPL